ncbi:hypothetical protein [Ornithinimicrobium cerasi]|uniref:Cell wall-active antibiotics response 4TMS YvqF n=1 Tax=Ornithinimicrobium cerasi TaxID=2248773 RepID=A0A285VSN1_9MICO|nr:hypothetical protein [Ornithinimicrobium cerasi]SOC57059.1 hypothetical protein SAMN05421879_11076 [Ornithinimicrobium cerasi]
MTGTPDEGQPQQHPAPPLPGPVEDVDRPMTIIGGPAAEDTPPWRAAPAQPPAYQHGGGSAAHLPARTGDPGTSLTGFFSTVRRTGRWEVPAVLSLVQGFSEVRLDLREAVVTSPVVELRIYGGFADCKIIVPPGVDVEWGGGASLFSDEKSDPPGARDPAMWRLKVLHYGAFSEIRVRTLAVGEVEPKWWRKFT